jgi:hypothetical protein
LFNTIGIFNTAIGSGALINNTTGGSNTVIGLSSGSAVVTADSVIAIGIEAADVSNTTGLTTYLA